MASLVAEILGDIADGGGIGLFGVAADAALDGGGGSELEEALRGAVSWVGEAAWGVVTKGSAGLYIDLYSPARWFTEAPSGFLGKLRGAGGLRACLDKDSAAWRSGDAQALLRAIGRAVGLRRWEVGKYRDWINFNRTNETPQRRGA